MFTYEGGYGSGEVSPTKLFLRWLNPEKMLFFLPIADELFTTIVDVLSGVQGVDVPDAPPVIFVPDTFPAMVALFF